mmetsp:Transcript_98017/g.274402  ORF Transcript_98017/g.274402 Transcript_98017/m.274402 type:complete len:174 (+) Transcript_98017:84-605(+)
MAEAVTMQVLVPDGVAPGGNFVVTTPDGQMLQLTCPEGSAPGTAIQFAYIPLAPPLESAEDITEHPDDQRRREEASAYAAQKQAELEAAGGAVAAAPLPEGGEFTGFVFAPALFQVGSNAIVTRSDGSESGCNITEVFLTALGPQYNVYLGQDEAGQPIFKWCAESDMRAYPS